MHSHAPSTCGRARRSDLRDARARVLQVALIVVGSVLGALLLGGLIVWRVTKQLRREVESVKGQLNSEQRSSISGEERRGGAGFGP